MALPQTTIAFMDESGTPAIPALAKKRGTVDDVFCMALCFMGIHYWQDLSDAYDATRTAYLIPTDRELKWANLLRKTGPAKHMDDAMVSSFVQDLVAAIDAQRFKAVVVSLWKDDVYTRKGYIQTDQDIYNVACRFALQRLQSDLDDKYGAGTNCPTLVVADSRRGADNRLRRFVDRLITGGDLWVDFRRSIVEGIMFQVSDYSVGIQIADLIAGAAFQKDQRGNRTYFDLWAPLLRTGPGGNYGGYGYVPWRG